jgi:REP element-mobilizing transposase RayT
MARPLRIEFEDAIYHVTARGNERQRVFRAAGDRKQFLSLLARSCERFEVSLLVFVLMGNHFHLVAQTHRGNLSRWMHWLMVSYTTWFNWRHDRSGHLFQGRYKSFLVEEGEYLLALSRYLHLNPVRGKVLGRGSPAERRKRLRGYVWSSYGGYAGMGEQLAFVQEEMVLGEMGGLRRGRALRYRRFVEEGLLREMASPLEAVQWQAVLGSENFARRIQDRMSDLREGRQEVTALRRGTPVLNPERVLQRVAKHYGLAVERLRGKKGGHGLEARNVALWLIWEKCGLSQRELGELFGGMNYAAVAQRLRRLKPESRKTAEKLIYDMSNI